MRTSSPNSQVAGLNKVGSIVTLSATCVAIALASARGTLRIEQGFNARLGLPYWAISDERGLIEVAMSAADADARVKGVAR